MSGPAESLAAVAANRSGAGWMAVLYEAHGHVAVRLAYLLTGDRALAEDLAQEAFVKAVGHFHHLRHPAAFQSYLRKTIVNLARSHHRRRRLERLHLSLERQRVTPFIEPPDIASRVDLREILMSLPVRQRAAIVLRYYEDLSEHQAADVLGCSPAAAKALVARAMETLRRQVDLEEDRDDRR